MRRQSGCWPTAPMASSFLMFDGNWWNGDCANPDHGHPVPYRMEDHIRANLELASASMPSIPRC